MNDSTSSRDKTSQNVKHDQIGSSTLNQLEKTTLAVLKLLSGSAVDIRLL